MARERLYLFDTTLRDGAQTNGVDFTLADKIVVAGLLDKIGIDYVEGGYPGANLTDTRLEDVDAWSLPGRAVFVALAYTPVGGDDGGSAIFKPRYGQ